MSSSTRTSARLRSRTSNSTTSTSPIINITTKQRLKPASPSPIDSPDSDQEEHSSNSGSDGHSLAEVRASDYENSTHPSGAALFDVQDRHHKKPVARPSSSTYTSRRRNVVVQLDLDDLWGCVTTPNVGMADLVRQWINEYLVHPHHAMLGVVNLMIQATGCPHKITLAQFQDPNAVPDYVQELEGHMPTDVRAYPLIVRTKLVKSNMASFFSFFSALLATDHKVLWDQHLLEIIESWIATMSSSSLRAFRHTATALALHLVTSMCPQLGKANHLYFAIVEETYKTMYDSVFVHRYRDVDPAIRRDCMRALAHWVELVPNRFLDPSYLRYFGWLLNDKDTGVRVAVLECISRLYKNPSVVPGLRMFTERFKSRILDMATREVDESAQCAAVETLCLVYTIGVLDASEIDTLSSAVFLNSSRNSSTHQYPKMSEALMGVWKSETESMDIGQFVEWLAKLLALVYPDAAGHADTPEDEEGSVSLAHHTDHAVVYLVRTMPTLAYFSNPSPLLVQLRRTDTTIPHDHLMLSIIAAIATNSGDHALFIGPHIPPLLSKYQSDNAAETFIYQCAVSIPRVAWCSPPMSAHFDTVVRSGQAAFERGATGNVLAVVSQLFQQLSEVSGLDVEMRSNVCALLADGCSPDRPRTYLEALRLIEIPEEMMAQVTESVSMIDDPIARIQARLFVAIQARSFDATLAEECMRMLESGSTRLEEDAEDEDEDRLAIARVTAANIYLEVHCVLPNAPPQLGGQALGLLETLVTDRIRRYLVTPKRSRKPLKHRDTDDYVTSDVAMIDMFAKALASNTIDGANTATLLQFYKRPPFAQDSISADDDVSLGIADVADAILFPKVLAEIVSESTLVQVCLSSLQRAFQLSEVDMHNNDEPSANGVDGAHAVGVPDLPGAVPKLARGLVGVFKLRKVTDGSSAKQVIEYGAQWVVNRFQPMVPLVPVSVDGETGINADTGEYETAVSEYHQSLASAVSHATPLLRGLREFVTLLTKPYAQNLYRQFRNSPIMESLVVALARKGEIKHTPSASITTFRSEAGGASTTFKKRRGGRGLVVSTSVQRPTTKKRRNWSRKSTGLLPHIESAEEVDERADSDMEVVVDQDSGRVDERDHSVARPKSICIEIERPSSRTRNRCGVSQKESKVGIVGGISSTNGTQANSEKGFNAQLQAGREEEEEERVPEFAPSPPPKRRRML